jgi:hypothetical protein
MLAFLLATQIAVAVAAEAAKATLIVQAQYPRDETGTMHFAEALTLSIAAARPLRVPGSFLPIPGPTFRLPDGRFILLGWSSPGSGMQSMHALLVGDRAGAVKLLDHLIYFTDRPNAALLVRTELSGSVFIGVPEPPSDFLHYEDEWSLQYGLPRKRRLLIDSIRKLSFETVTSRSDDVFYAPPTNSTPRTARVAWVHVANTGFAMASEPKAQRR